MEDYEKSLIIFTINKFNELGKDKYINIFYNFMCPKAREIHLNKYKAVGYDIPEFLTNKEDFNNVNININFKIYIIFFIILIIIIIIICYKLKINS